MPKRLQYFRITISCQAHAGVRHEGGRRSARYIDKETFRLEISGEFLSSIFSTPIRAEESEISLHQLFSISLVAPYMECRPEVGGVVCHPLVEEFPASL